MTTVVTEGKTDSFKGAMWLIMKEIEERRMKDKVVNHKNQKYLYRGHGTA